MDSAILPTKPTPLNRSSSVPLLAGLQEILSLGIFKELLSISQLSSSETEIACVTLYVEAARAELLSYIEVP